MTEGEDDGCDVDGLMLGDVEGILDGDLDGVTDGWDVVGEPEGD